MQPNPADESFSHPLVMQASEPSDGWAERTYHLLHVDDAVVLHAGRAVHPHTGRRRAFAGASDGRCQRVLRLAGVFADGDDPDDGRLDALRIEAVRPLEEVRLVLDDNPSGLAFDLTYRARAAPAAPPANRIEHEGRVVTDYRSLFQSGRYSGTVVVGEAEHRVADRAGFRDRGWGLRKHEGAPARGLVVACFCELPAMAVYLILYETASGRRAFTHGWLVEEGGEPSPLEGVEHDLVWDGTLLRSGRLHLDLASGAGHTLTLDVVGRIFLSAAGYAASSSEPGAERHDVTDPAVVAALDGQTDHACVFALDGVQGHGFVETGLGIHARYRPEEAR